jgi:hypothetical protein
MKHRNIGGPRIGNVLGTTELDHLSNKKNFSSKFKIFATFLPL